MSARSSRSLSLKTPAADKSCTRSTLRASAAPLSRSVLRQAGAWARARILRRYIHAARRTVGDRTIQVPFLDKSIDFLDWATNHVDQLDPLSNVPPNPDQRPEPRSYVYPDEDALKGMFLRITGFDGHPAPKLTDSPSHDSNEYEDEDDFDSD